ncbi:MULTISPECIES: LysR family transcriptional regulator [unclassified Vibrio]|uniref:LysR family transcriptional regulator n=1 Tax=Vibrio sp. HB236076 TaxID=3232307 RepID=A0AB39HJK7_9VIBR|nr:LysR family transcriptional regulator [Vibrio sp. HB161653]MDP5254672.1 LysR family transcriptional regulator [Vibrio sp. HB161653]
MNNLKISDLKAVLVIAELQSITLAAQQLNISSSAASIALKRIEQSLGTQIFIRTTRKIRLTPEGEQFLPLCQQALALLQQGQSLINEEQQTIRGDIRMAMSSEMGRNLMRELLNSCLEQHPEIILRLHVSDSRADFYRDGVDVALRAMTKETVKELNLHGFKICNIPHSLCASPLYFEKNDLPTHPNELVDHNTLHYKLYDTIHDIWDFYREGQHYRVRVSGNRAVNDGDIVRRWSVDGVGIAKKSMIDIADDLLERRLIRIMPEYQIPLTEMWLVLPSRQLISPAIRLIRDELKDKIKQRRSALIKEKIITENEWPLE